MAKRIIFTGCDPAYCGAEPSLACVAEVDGKPARYEVTAEALEDHFGARSCRWEDLLAAFEAHRPQIEAVARETFEMTDAHHIVLHSGMFRFET